MTLLFHNNATVPRNEVQNMNIVERRMERAAETPVKTIASSDAQNGVIDTKVRLNFSIDQYVNVKMISLPSVCVKV